MISLSLFRPAVAIDRVQPSGTGSVYHTLDALRLVFILLLSGTRLMPVVLLPMLLMPRRPQGELHPLSETRNRARRETS